MGFGGVTSDATFQNLNDSSQPIGISFRYHRLKEKDWGENRVTIPFANLALPSFSDDQPPTTEIQLGTPRTDTSTVEIKLPTGWTATLPDEVHERTAFASCDVTYRLENGKIFAERKLVVRISRIPVLAYKEYQGWYDLAGASGIPFLQLVPPVQVHAK
jgi:hypothetical protein